MISLLRKVGPVFLLLNSALAGYVIASLIRWRKKIRHLEKKRSDFADFRVGQLKSIYREIQHHDETYSDEDKESILSLTATELIASVRDGRLSPRVILDVFILKALEDNESYNSVTCFIEQAFAEVKQLEATPDANEKLLYGLPVSVKESMNIKSLPSCIGLSTLIDELAIEDCVLAQVLKHCGAVPFAKTNGPQTLLSFESSNPVFGETVNPLNPLFTPGGSSSGEGSLIASGGSVLGFGTDIAGSIRCPAHMCGIAGFKPTMGRISKRGLQGSLPGQSLVSATLGPMAREVDTLVLSMKALLCPLMFQLDPDVPPMPFNETVYGSSKSLRIGYYIDDGYIKPVPAVQRAVIIAKEALEKAGHVLVPFQVPKVADAMRIVTKALNADGGVTNTARLKYDKIDHRIRKLHQDWNHSRLWRFMKTSFLGFKWPRLAQDLELTGGGDRSVHQLWATQCEASDYKKLFFESWNNGDGNGKLDAVICPPYPITAAPLGSVSNLSGMMSYLVLYNLLNCPAGVVPVTQTTANDVASLSYYRGHYDDPWDNVVKQACTDSIGMPVGVQCVAAPWCDELCLRVMKQVEDSVGFKLSAVS